MKKHFSVIALSLAILIISGCKQSVTTSQNQDDKLVLPTSANVYLVALNDNGKSGKKIGCEDSLVPLELKLKKEEQEVPIKAVLDHLLEQKYPSNKFYNALYQSNLKLDRITSDRENKTGIYLSGTLQLGGVCDGPRVEEQLKQTVLQFDKWVSSVEIFINDKPIAEALSLK